ncbi:MAG: DUF4349 domain-containing protein [Methylocystis silviterrae]|uniref:DUF4349 domain-containing protein n=1 Tax=Methylocystis silviterrae TaxID=2743612 RepID=UPI003C70FC94
MKNRERRAGALRRGAAILGIALLPVAFAGCQDEEQAESRRRPQTFGAAQVAQPFAGAGSIQAARPATSAKFAYTHELWIVVAPRWVGPHFERAKSLCASDASLRCVLLDASTNLNDGGPSRPSANLQVRLPHESVAAFTKIVTTAVEGENPSDVVVTRSATRLEDLAQPLADTKRRREQLDDYRNRLKALEGRADMRAEDLIKIANELSRTQSQIEEIDEQRRKLEERVDTELVSVFIQSETPAGGPLAPIDDVWKRAANIIGASAAAALRFALMATPWTPLVFIVALLLRWIGCAFVGRRKE